MKFIATIEARMRSTRLPNKVMLPIMGKPMLQLMIERLKYSKRLNEIVVATTVNPADDKIAALAKKLKVGCYRGSEADVLARVLEAASQYRADIIVELTGDCPLVDPAMIDEMIAEFQKSGVDYLANNTIKQLIPRGFDIQVFPKKVLEEVSGLTNDPFDRENVSLYIYEHPEKFKIKEWGPEKRLQRNDLRLTVDTARDFELIKRIFHLLYSKRHNFTLADTVAVFEQFPVLAQINQEVEQKKARYSEEENKKLINKAVSGIYGYVPKLKAVIVGCGNIAGKFDDDPKRMFIASHAGAYQTNPDVSLVAACDVSAPALSEFGKRWSLEKLYSDYKEMFRKEKPDIVSICTTPEYHYQIAEEAIKQKIPVIICEKPFGNNPETAEQLAKRAKKGGVKLLVHYNRRYDKYHRELRGEISSGGHGKFLSGTIYYSNGLLNNGCHAVDLALMLFGGIKSVRTVGSYDSGQDFGLDVVLTLSSGGIIALRYVNSQANYLFEADLLFEKTRIKLEDLGRRIVRINSVPHPRISGINAYEGKIAVEEGILPQSLPALVGLLCDKKQAVDSNAIESSKDLEILVAAKTSFKENGKLINLPLNNKKVILFEKAVSK